MNLKQIYFYKSIAKYKKTLFYDNLTYKKY